MRLAPKARGKLYCLNLRLLDDGSSCVGNRAGEGSAINLCHAGDTGNGDLWRRAKRFAPTNQQVLWLNAFRS
jgi:hypothetical protein